MQLSSTPAPTLPAAPLPQPDPWWWRPWPPRTPQKTGGGAALRAFLGLDEAARGFSALHPGRRPPGQAHPARLRAPGSPSPRVPLCTYPLPGPRGHLTYPAVQGPGLGQGAWITSGWDAPLRPTGPALSGDLSCSQTLGASGSSCSSPPPTPPPPSLLSLGSFFRVNYVSH